MSGVGRTDREPSVGRIVVGVDGSAGSLAALHWAAKEARFRGVDLHAVMTWQHPSVYGAPNLSALGVDPSIDTERALASAAEAVVARLGDEVGTEQQVRIICEAVEGHPAEALVLAAVDAAVLVVGTRGYGGFVGALLGSVSQHVVAHAPCPVVIVPGPGRRRRARS